ncbi:glycosyltransferase family 39 protein [Aerosakkonemataceae cyanobacterium BLCC-F154]|uniref:Glycosyltransferase family 39 protein n=1 Tax=Floridaenema fluviatile BLCC-F154 TaxID=3153640 RepID=A0ABV4YG60_9CYAN
MTKPKLIIRPALELVAFLAIAIGVVLRLVYLGAREFWYDEVLSLIVATGQNVNYKTPEALPVPLRDYTALLTLPSEANLGEAIATFRNVFKSLLGDVHPPLSFLTLHFWIRLFGNSDAATHGQIVLFSLIAIFAAYGLGRLLLGHRGGLLLAALLATNPYYLSHSLNIRMYGGLVLWTILSAWALLELIKFSTQEETKEAKSQDSRWLILWNILLIGAVTAGLMTQYLFAYWLITLSILVLICDRSHWWQHGLRLGFSVLLTIPWILWGTRQQLRNRPNLGGQFDRTGSIEHLWDVAQTLGTQLVLGDWVTSLPKIIPIVTGCVVILLLTACTISLWKQGIRRSLIIALVLGILPLLLASAVDIISGKFTVSFGWGRTMIFILPGCLLLVTLWLEKAAGKWQMPIAVTLLVLYLGIGISDFSLRQRWMFHQVADIIQQQPTTPTLIALNSNAWGHVLRLAYYTPANPPVMLLAQPPAKLAPSLEKVLNETNTTVYPRIIWLDSANPVWSQLKTEVEREKENQKIDKLLQSGFKLTQKQELSGTMSMDKFTVKVYTRAGDS